MTAPIDRNLVARLSHDTYVMSQQLNNLGNGLALLQSQLAQIRTVPGPIPTPVQAPPVRPVQPMVVAPKQPWWERDGIVSRLLAISGAAVTLIGVVMLVVLAAEAGVFGPVARVAAGAALSAGLVVAAFRVVGRPGGRVGAIALAATGFAGGYLDVVAMTTIYRWAPAFVGLAVALAIAAAGVQVAVRWDAQQLALMSVVGVAVLGPVVTGGITMSLVAFLVVLQLAAAPVHVVKDWSYLHSARTAPVLLALAGAVVDGSSIRTLLASVAVVVIGLASGLVALRVRPSDVTAGVVMAVSSLPLVLWSVHGHLGWVAAMGVGAVFTGLSVLPSLPGHARISSLVAGAVGFLGAAAGATTGQTIMLALFGIACGYIAAAGTVERRLPFAIGCAFAALGGLQFLDQASPESLTVRALALQNLDGVVLAASVLALSVAGLVVWSATRLGLPDDGAGRGLLVVTGLSVLYTVTAVCVTVGVLLGGDGGFTVGHMAATVLWMAVAAAALLWGLATPEFTHVALGAGLALVAAALGKLFLYDLAALDGLIRVAVFIVVGLLLMVVGTRYARAFAQRAA